MELKLIEIQEDNEENIEIEHVEKRKR